jgi:hypothetical protein
MTGIATNFEVGRMLPRALRGGGRTATVVIVLHDRDCSACAAYLAQLSEQAAEIDAWDGRVKYVRDVAEDAPAVIIADQWGEIAVAEHAGAAHRFMELAEVITWLRHLAMKCPECEGEAL